ncbi:MAG: hypothetical protein Q7W44_08120 [Coriobacteriia bacterium]|nr:hypothetical protein [Coriobacteriia bacterium]
MSDDLGMTGTAPESVPGPETPKQGYFATPTGRIVGIVIGLGVLLLVAGIAVAIVVFVLAGDAADDLLVQPLGEPTTSASAGTTETAPTAEAPAAPLPNSAVFTFRDIFDPLLKPPPATSTDDGTPPPTDPDTVTPTTDGTLYLNDIVTEDGVLKAVLALGDSTYTLAVGEGISGTPWEVLRISSTQVTMLYGDVQVTLGIGQGILK